jgi:hypothetical protein
MSPNSPSARFRARLDVGTPALRESLTGIGRRAYEVLNEVKETADVWPEFRPVVNAWHAEQIAWLDAQAA